MHAPAHDESAAAPLGPGSNLPAQPSPADQGPAGARRIESSELLGGANEVLIAHGSETYRLRLTRSGKLILHK